MLIRHFANGLVYQIEVPDESLVERRSHRLGATGEFLSDRILIPFEGAQIPVFADPPGLLPLLAEAGHYGLRLLSEPRPNVVAAQTSSESASALPAPIRRRRG